MMLKVQNMKNIVRHTYYRETRLILVMRKTLQPLGIFAIHLGSCLQRDSKLLSRYLEHYVVLLTSTPELAGEGSLR